MGYQVGGGAERKTICGWLWWKKTCAWFETGAQTGSIDEWFNDYPLSEYPSRQFKCSTCGKVEWR